MRTMPRGLGPPLPPLPGVPGLTPGAPGLIGEARPGAPGLIGEATPGGEVTPGCNGLGEVREAGEARRMPIPAVPETGIGAMVDTGAVRLVARRIMVVAMVVGCSLFPRG